MLQIQAISTPKALEKISLLKLHSLPLNLTPNFLNLSLEYLQDNQLLIEKAGFENPEIIPHYFLIRKGKTDLALSPRIHIQSSQSKLNLAPSKSFKEGLINLTSSSLDTESLEFEFMAAIGQSQYLYSRIGWEIQNSLFEIFKWFPSEDRKIIIDPTHKISLETSTYLRDKDFLEALYQEHFEKMGDTATFLHRNNEIFYKNFGEDFRILLIHEKDKPIGAISLVSYKGGWHLTNALYKKLHAQIMFQLFALAKKSNIKSIEVASFEWCLKPFVSKIMQEEKCIPEALQKKIAKMNRRNMREIL